MFLYMLAFMLTTVIEQELFVQKACLVNNNFTKEVCDNLKNETYNSSSIAVQVCFFYNKFNIYYYWLNFYTSNTQITVSNFQQWNHIAEKIFPVIMALFIGAWSDKRGRKLLLIIGLTGKLIYVVALLFNIYYGKPFFSEWIQLNIEYWAYALKLSVTIGSNFYSKYLFLHR